MLFIHKVGLIFALVICSSRPAACQQDNPTQDLINLGRRAFDDLDYRAADSIARQALDIPGLKRGQRIQALELAAASRFPASESDRHADSALVVLRALVRIAPAAAIPRTLTWPGLDSLFAVARRTTFGASVSVPDSARIDGLNGRVTLDVVASRPAMFSLRIARANDPGLGELVDSIGPVERGAVKFAPVQADIPRYPSGTYRLTIIATDPSSSERVDLVIAGVFETPPVQIRHLPLAHNALDLQIERTTPSRVRAIASGILIGGFILAAGRAYRAEPFKGSALDSRTSTWAVGLGAATAAVAWYLDRGRPIESTVQFNRALRTRWAQEDAGAITLNEQARMLYHAVVRLTQEDR